MCEAIARSPWNKAEGVNTDGETVIVQGHYPMERTQWYYHLWLIDPEPSEERILILKGALSLEDTILHQQVHEIKEAYWIDPEETCWWPVK